MSRRFLLRLLAAAPPSEHVSDAELLRRFVKERDCAALELLVRRHADAVWAACRRVCRCEADAEDAFQASFLALLKSASSVRGSCAGGWLHRVAVNASLKLRAARATSMETAALDALPAKTDERDSEVASAVHEELARLSETERLPVVLCDLEGLTHSAAADALGWPVGTVAGRLSRARAKLRARLARRGFAPCAVPALVAPPALVSSAVSLSAGAPPHAVALLAEGVLSAMHSAKLKLAACAALVCAAVGTALALAPQPADPLPARPAARAADPEKPPALPAQLEPGIAALAGAATDVLVVEVLETNPSKAIEGARDTVKLKVERALLGALAPGDEIGVYYHLLWSDEAAKELEPPKFVRGNWYLVFLKSQRVFFREEGKPRREYQPVDQHLWVQPERAALVRAAATAVRALHGSARGEWSEAVGPLQARLVIDRDAPATGTPILRARLDVRNVAGGDNTVEFLLDEAKVKWEVTDARGGAVKPGSPPGNWLPRAARKLTLAAQESGRLPLSITGAGVAPNDAGHLELASDQVWSFARDAKGPFHLRGSITITADGKPGRWFGTLELPKVRLPLADDAKPK